jgi:hypothetical protein
MSTSLEDFIDSHPNITLCHTEYGRHFYLGGGVNISSSPTQRLQSFVDDDGPPFRFVIIGELMSFKVVEDPVGFYLFSLVSSEELSSDAICHLVWTLCFCQYWPCPSFSAS